MDGDGGAVPHILAAPDGLEQLLLGKDGIGVLGQKFQQGKFPVGHLDLPAVLHHLPALGQNLHVAQADDLRLPLSPAGEPGIPAEVGLDPGGELRRVKWLGDVVVRPQAQPTNLVHRLGAGGDHKDGHIDPVPNQAADVVAIASREHQVQQDQAKIPVQRLGHRLLAVVYNGDLKALYLQVVPLQHGDLRVVLGDQDLGHMGTSKNEMRPGKRPAVLKRAGISQRQARSRFWP